MPDPGAAPVRAFLLLVPNNPVAVRHAGDEVRQSVPVHVLHVNESGRAQVEFLMDNPLAFPRIRGRFEPAPGRDDVVPSILIDIAQADSVAVAVRADDVTHPFGVTAFANQFIPGHGKIFVSELREELFGLSRVHKVNQENKFDRGARLNYGFPPGFVLSARIFPPGKRLLPVGTTDNIGISVSINIDGYVAQVLDVTIGVTEVAKVVFDPARPLPSLSGERLFVPVLAGYNVQPAIPVDVGYGHALAAPEVNRLFADWNFVRSRGFHPSDIPPKASRGDEGEHDSALGEDEDCAQRRRWQGWPFPNLSFYSLLLDFFLQLTAFCRRTTGSRSFSVSSSLANRLMNLIPRFASSSPEGAMSRQIAAAAARSGSGRANDSIVSQPS